MDTLDPLTEIINQGQAFLPFVKLERFLWVMMGFFFFGAISSSFIRGMKQKNWSGNKSFFSSLAVVKKDDKLPIKLSEEDK